MDHQKVYHLMLIDNISDKPFEARHFDYHLNMFRVGNVQTASINTGLLT